MARSNRFGPFVFLFVRLRGHQQKGRNGWKAQKGRKALQLVVASIVAPAGRPVSGVGVNPGNKNLKPWKGDISSNRCFVAWM